MMKRKVTNRHWLSLPNFVPEVGNLLFQNRKEAKSWGVTYTQALLDNCSAASSGSFANPAPWFLKTEFIYCLKQGGKKNPH